VTERRRQFEIATTGFNEYLQLVGGDPFGGQTSVGLRVPTLATPLLDVGGGQKRYLFNLASFSVGEGACVRIRGYRQLLTIGYKQPSEIAAPRVVEQLVTSPFWAFQDGNVSWHITLCGSPNASSFPKGQNPGPVDINSFKQYWADTPSLLYGPPAPAAFGGIYPNLATYTPPNAGKPYGDPIASGQGTFYDIRSPWTDDRAWYSLDIPIRGPETIVFWASIRQTSPGRRVAITPPGTFYPGGLSAEEQFLLNFPSAIYWRVGGALVVEEA